MKTIRVTLGDRLLALLDADEEIQRDGRSAVLARAAFEYLRLRKRDELAQAYEQTFAHEGSIDLDGGVEPGGWPER